MSLKPYFHNFDKPTNLLPINFGQTSKSKRYKQAKCPPHLKSAIRRRWWNDSLNGKCFSCGRNLYYDDAHVGHIKAKSKGGDWSPKNNRLTCQQCNTGMRETNMQTYMRRYYPERYKKLILQDEDKTTKKARKGTHKRKTTRSKPKSPFGQLLTSQNELTKSYSRAMRKFI